MKYRVMSGWVTLTGPPVAICFLKVGITLPEEPSTLPNRTAINFVRSGWFAQSDCTKISARRLVAPMTLVGLMALSVETMTNRSTLNSSAMVATQTVPRMLFLMASVGCRSIMGTCLCAAAWNTTWG